MQIPLKELLCALSKALDFVEQELLGVTSNHGKRAAYISAHLCRAVGMSEADIFDMAGCAILHDNALTAYMRQAKGQIGRLEHFKSHCAIGENNAAVFPFLGDVRGIILHHHENWDGSGFHQLTGEAIPLRAQVLRLADNMDLGLHLGDGRAGVESEIREHAQKYSGKLYSPLLVEALLDSLDEEFSRGLRDCCIDDALSRVVPDLDVELSTKKMLEVCQIFALIIDAKSRFTRNHSSGIADKAGYLARCFGLAGGMCDQLRVAGYLHDVGKLATPLHILEKPGALTGEEWEIMRRHVLMSEEILKQITGLDQLARWAWNHHEKLNGTGYPHGYVASELPFESRLLACCDIYQALTEDRPYREGMAHGAAMSILNDMVNKGELDGEIIAALDREFRS